jgi:tetratricopeptide (TPR) repeat protein
LLHTDFAPNTLCSAAPFQEPQRYSELTANSAWESEPWTGDDRPFAEARASIDRAFKATNDLSSHLTEYETLAKAHPDNSLYQFQWAYAFLLQGSIPHQTARDGMAMVIAIAGARQPHTYDYARLRFIYQPVGLEGRTLALRLLEKDADDVYVREAYAGILSASKSRDDEELAVKTIQDLVDKRHDIPGACQILAGVYANVGFLEKNPDYYKKSIDASNLFLKLTPSYDWRRAAALHSIDVLQRRLKENK